jgi:hypothetical protein
MFNVISGSFGWPTDLGFPRAPVPKAPPSPQQLYVKFKVEIKTKCDVRESGLQKCPVGAFSKSNRPVFHLKSPSEWSDQVGERFHDWTDGVVVRARRSGQLSKSRLNVKINVVRQ